MEKKHQEQQGLLISITRDCEHILEAIRRLREGTWYLNHEDADWTNFLFPQIKGALQDHIEYENFCIFPGLPDFLVKEHSAEHEKITALLWAIDQSRLNMDAERLHVFLDLLVTVLDLHHKKFGCHLPRVTQCNDGCAAGRIVQRAQGSSLENL
jgi:hypothetical protein